MNALRLLGIRSDLRSRQSGSTTAALNGLGAKVGRLLLQVLIVGWCMINVAAANDKFEDELGQAYELASRPIPKHDRMRASLSVGRGRDKLEALAKERPDDVRPLLALGWCGINPRYGITGGHAGEPEGIEYFDRVLRRQPANAEALKGRAWLLLRLARYKDALIAFDRFVAAAPLDPGSHGGRGVVHFMLQQDDAAQEDFARYFCMVKGIAEVTGSRLTPSYKIITANLGPALLAKVSDGDRSPDFFLALGVALQLAENNEAGRAFRKSYDLAGDRRKSVHALAIGDLSLANALGGNVAEVTFLASLREADLGAAHRAEALYRSALSIKPEDPIFRAGYPKILHALAEEKVRNERVAEQEAVDRRDREAFERFGRRLFDAVGVAKVFVEEIDPTYREDPAAPVKYTGPDQCGLCKGRGRVLYYPTLRQQCAVCGGSGYVLGERCTECDGSGATYQKQGDLVSGRCVDCDGTGRFDGKYDNMRTLTDGDVMLRRFDRAIIDHGKAVLADAGKEAPPEPTQPEALATQAAPAVERPLPDSPPQIRLQVPAIYPLQLRNAGTIGEVKLGFVVDVDGSVKDIALVSSSNAGFEQAAIEALSKWKFRPAYKAGKPIATKVKTVIAFNLTDD
ncbi:MAG TPA: TonB family protein [Opitutus sp.]|nr:TonB family protein [Opitutus sp.]